MSPEATTADLAVITKQEDHVVELVARARVHRITDDTSRALAADLRGALKRAEKQIEDVRVALVKPLNDHVHWINAKCRPLADTLAGGVRTLDAEIVRDRREREAAVEAERRRILAEAEAARRKAEEEQQARAREIALQAQAAAVTAGMGAEEGKQLGELYAADELAKPAPPVLHVAPPPPPAKTIAGATGATVTTREILDFELTDLVALARALPDAIEVKRGKVLEYGRCQERGGQAPALDGVRFFRRDSVAG